MKRWEAWDEQEMIDNSSVMVVKYLSGKVKNIVLDKDEVKTTPRRFRQNPTVKTVRVI